MRIAACLGLAPRKLGSLEQWLVEFCEEAVRRLHSVHLFCEEPVHPAIAERLRRTGVSWTPLDRLEASPLRWARRLSRSFDVVYLNLIVPQSRVALITYLAWPVRVLYFDEISGPTRWESRRTLASRLLDPLTFARVTAVAGCSRYVTERDERRFGVPPERCTVIYNGIDPVRFQPAAPADSHPPVIVTVAYLIREKGIDLLIEACRALQDLAWKLVIVGDGPEEPRLRALAAASGFADRISFAGLRDDVDRIFRDSDIYAHPALWQEAFGLTITEAMASECATIASRIGGIPEIIEDEVSGLLFPAGDVAALSATLRRVLNDPALRRRLGAAGRARVIERFTLQAAVTGQVDWVEHWCQVREPTGRADRADPILNQAD